MGESGLEMEKQEQLLPNPRRSILQMAVAGILNDVGFAKSDKQCVETLTEVRYGHWTHILLNEIFLT